MLLIGLVQDELQEDHASKTKLSLKRMQRSVDATEDSSFKIAGERSGAERRETRMRRKVSSLFIQCHFVENSLSKLKNHNCNMVNEHRTISILSNKVLYYSVSVVFGRS